MADSVQNIEGDIPPHITQSVQYISGADKNDLAVVPVKVWDEVMSLLKMRTHDVGLMQQDIQDIVDSQQAWRAYLEYPEQHIPTDVFDQVLDGANPVKIYREWRGYSVKELSVKTGISEQIIYGIESGSRKGNVSHYQKIAHALNLIVDDIIPVKRQPDGHFE